MPEMLRGCSVGGVFASLSPDPTLIGPRNHHGKHQMAFQSCLYPGPVRQAHGPEVLERSITHLKCRYELATQMPVTIATSGLGQHVAWSFLSDRG